MIEKIERLDNFGIFQNFIWNGALGPFKSKNIIYGWNYSGKTTLSRLFSSIKNKQLPIDYSSANFKVKTSVGDIDKQSIQTSELQIEVFNSDYVHDNLRWEEDQAINAITFEVGDNVKISNEIDDLKKNIDEIVGSDNVIGKIRPLQGIIDAYDAFENSLFSSEAKRIKDQEFLSLINFDKRTLRNYIPDSPEGLTLNLIHSTKEQTEVRKIVLMTEPKTSLAPIQFTPRHGEIATLLTEIFEEVPSKKNVIDILENDNNAYEWVKKGVELHKNNSICRFCGSQITDARYNSLLEYFNSQTSKLRAKADAAFNLLNAELEYCNSMLITTSENDLNDSFQTDFKQFKQDFNRKIGQYQKLLNKYRNKLRFKLDQAIFKQVSCSIDDKLLKEINSLLSALNELITNNNSFTDNFSHIVSSNRGRYQAHLVATFLQKAKFYKKKKDYEIAKSKIGSLNNQVESLQNAIVILEQRKESKTEGCAQLNSFVQSFFSRTDIEIKSTEDGRYKLMRGNSLARNLSEGERMAISFAHFLVQIKSLHQRNTLKDYIIFIDDPISSLDSNHIFQINALLKDSFFEKIGNTWSVKCKQLFISTHNFEFFNLLMELPIPDAQKRLDGKEARYFISRNKDGAVIEQLPKAYDSYKSEYHFLFGELYRFHNNTTKNSHPRLYLMPNIIRRFLEMYTLTKYPSKESVEERTSVVFDSLTSKRILKPLHYHSHLNCIDRIGKHSDFLADIATACHVLLEHIESKDELHYNALLKSL